MNTSEPVQNDKTMFRLDFALRGHAAYVEPMNLEALVSLVEQVHRRMGGPLLRQLADEPRHG